MAGHDATRAFALFDAKSVKDEHDDLAGLSDSDLNDALEWEDKLRVKYPYVGRLLQPDEQPKDYAGEIAMVKYGELKPLKIRNGGFVEG